MIRYNQNKLRSTPEENPFGVYRIRKGNFGKEKSHRQYVVYENPHAVRKGQFLIERFKTKEAARECIKILHGDGDEAQKAVIEKRVIAMMGRTFNMIDCDLLPEGSKPMKRKDIWETLYDHAYMYGEDQMAHEYLIEVVLPNRKLEGQLMRETLKHETYSN